MNHSCWQMTHKCSRTRVHAWALVFNACAHWSCVPAADACGLLRSFFCLVLCQTLLDIRWRLELGLLGTGRSTTGRWIPRRSATFGLSLGILTDDALLVTGPNIVWDTFHTEDLDVRAGAVGQSVLDGSQSLLVYLGHMNGQA